MRQKRHNNRQDTIWIWACAIIGVLFISFTVILACAGLKSRALCGNNNKRFYLCHAPIQSGHPDANYTASDKFSPPILKGLIINPRSKTNYFDFLLDSCHCPACPGNPDALLAEKMPQLEPETRKLINYFFLGITLPSEDFWVNLNFAQKDKIISPRLGLTDMGRIMLEADLMLKKDTACLTDPRNPVGAKYWQKIKEELRKSGLVNSPVPNGNRVWIVPDEAVVNEEGDSITIIKSSLKVCLESDYLASYAEKSIGDGRSFSPVIARLDRAIQTKGEAVSIAEQAMKETILPVLEYKVNHSQAYAPLRQIYNSLILAECYKRKYWGKRGFYPYFVNQCELQGLMSGERWNRRDYFNAYVRSVNQGEYTFTRSEYDPYQLDMVRRRYISGGIRLSSPVIAHDKSGAISSPVNPDDSLILIEVISSQNSLAPWQIKEVQFRDEAMRQFQARIDAHPGTIMDESLRNLAKQSGLSVPAVRNILRQSNKYSKGVGSRKNVQNFETWIEKLPNEVEKYSQRELSEQFGIAQSTISLILKKHNKSSKNNRKPRFDNIEEVRDTFILQCLLKNKDFITVKDFPQQVQRKARENNVYLPVSKVTKGIYLLFGFGIPREDADEFCITDEALESSWKKLRLKYHPDSVNGDENKRLLYEWWFKHINSIYGKLCKRREWLRKTSGEYFPGIGIKKKKVFITENSSSPMDPSAAKKQKILLVDDDATWAILYEKWIKDAGFQIISAYDVDQALDSWKKEKPDLTVTDMELSSEKEGGIKLANEIRKIDPNALIVIQTGNFDNRVKKKIETMCSDVPYIIKRDKTKLIDTVKAKLKEKDAKSGLPEEEVVSPINYVWEGHIPERDKKIMEFAFSKTDSDFIKRSIFNIHKTNVEGEDIKQVKISRFLTGQPHGLKNLYRIQIEFKRREGAFDFILKIPKDRIDIDRDCYANLAEYFNNKANLIEEAITILSKAGVYPTLGLFLKVKYKDEKILVWSERLSKGKDLYKKLQDLDSMAQERKIKEERYKLAINRLGRQGVAAYVKAYDLLGQQRFITDIDLENILLEETDMLLNDMDTIIEHYEPMIFVLEMNRYGALMQDLTGRYYLADKRELYNGFLDALGKEEGKKFLEGIKRDLEKLYPVLSGERYKEIFGNNILDKSLGRLHEIENRKKLVKTILDDLRRYLDEEIRHYESTNSSPAKKVTILLVDDEKEPRKEFAYFFQKEGFRVITAGSAEEALAIQKNEKLDYMVTDMGMYPRDGSSLTREAKEINPELPVIICSRVVTDEIKKQIEKQFPGVSYIKKGYEIVELVKANLKKKDAKSGDSTSSPIDSEFGGISLRNVKIKGLGE